MKLAYSAVLALNLVTAGMPAAAEPYTHLLAVSEVALGQTTSPRFGETLSFMTRSYRIEVWIPQTVRVRDRSDCEVTLFRIEEVEDDDPNIFNYDEFRLATYDDPNCSGALQLRGSAGEANIPATDPFFGAMADFAEPPFDALGASQTTINAQFAIRDRLSSTFLDLKANRPRVEHYLLRLTSDRLQGHADFQVIFDGDDGICTLHLRLGRPLPLLTANLIMLPPPRDSRVLELQDDSCDGMFDFAFLEFGSVELGLGGYLINGRWVEQSAQLMAVGLALMDWADELVRATRPSETVD